MEVTNSLLVALMFVTILTLGIANILMALASVVDPESRGSLDVLHTGWALILLFAHFDFFWHTLDIVTKEDWDFLGFLYLEAGPILIFFATSVLLTDTGTENLRAYYFRIHTRFFLLFAFLQAWAIGADLVLGKGLIGIDAINVAVGPLALVLATSRAERLHLGLTGAVAVAYVIAAGMRGAGLIV